MKIKGIAIREGVMVATHWSVLRVGICAPKLDKFVRDGHFVIGHDWDDEGCGVILSANMNGRNEVEFEAEIYEGVPCCDDLATIISQRQKAGKTISLSAGFFCAGLAFASGADLLGWLAREGDDLSQYDTAAISAWVDWIYLITEIDFVEVSYVLDGAVDEAVVLDVFAKGQIDRSQIDNKLAQWRATTALGG